MQNFRLTDIDVHIMGNPTPGFGGRYFIFVKLTTNNGIEGWGEAYAATIGPEAMEVVIRDVFERHIAGEDPSDIELLYRRVFSSGFTQRPDLTVMGAFSAIEMACWDIVGKAYERPIWSMLGGKLHDRIRAYTYLYPKMSQNPTEFYNDPIASAQRASELVDAGFTALKFDPAGPYTIMGGHQPSMSDLDRCENFCAKIREAIGTRADILFGTHGQFTTSGAIRLAKRIEKYDPLWFEEPCPPDNLLEFEKVAHATSIPVATGERLCGKSEFATILRTGGASILQPALGRVGGIWEAKKIAIMAESFNAQIAPHLYAGPIEWVANLHLAASCPNFLIAETILTGDGVHGDLIFNGVDFDSGYLSVPSGPGLGVEINEELILANPYQGDRLHLEMHPTAIDYSRENRFGGG